ncbi:MULTISPECIES: ABC transporter ATP-binding protein [unclassified Pseudomonas]|uniref:ABC transporter ATP-binding protein n=1 Tax=unclassified Pseudomonas TaxID=196821 RepID=UPI0015A15930|nr:MULTISPECIES: ABC transporter ATP-binding protein [unclassified Pseudomonas]NWC95293.1 ABC transporter ATP-binding protein [Pseudomonas sp. IPO3779]NWD17107.1 ABC transporter ATP-binding protein [Pseudomonas sp. IPO3778]
MIEITSLAKNMGGKSIIHDFSFSAQPQECLGLFGNDGAGKTTIIKMLSGSMTPSSGHIKIFGNDIALNARQAKNVTGYQPELPLSHSAMSVKGFLGFIADIRGFHGADKRKMIDRAIARLELWRILKCPIEALPTGLKRKVAIAQAILHDPAVLLLDEPTDGLNADQKHKIRMLIKSLNDEMTIIVASRTPEELTSICSRALVIAEGRLVADTSMPELQRSSRHYQAVTLAADTPLDLLALAVLPGVAGIEEDRETPGTVTVLAMPGQTIYPHINALITHRHWKINALNLDPGRVDDVIHHMSQEASN